MTRHCYVVLGKQCTLALPLWHCFPPSPLPPMGNIQKFLGKEGSNLWWLGIITMRTTNFPSQSTVPWKRGIIWCDCQHESILDSYVELILPNFVFKVYCESWGRKWSQLCLVWWTFGLCVWRNIWGKSLSRINLDSGKNLQFFLKWRHWVYLSIMISFYSFPYIMTQQCC